MMTDERAEYLASGAGADPADRERLDLLRQVLARHATWFEPPPEVADRLLDVIGEERHPAPIREPRHRRWPWAAAFAAVALVIVVVGALGVLDAPGHVIAIAGTDLRPDATGEASIHESGAGWWISLEVSGLPPADEGTYYEGWLWSDDGDGISIGTFHLRGHDEAIVLWSGVDPDEYPSLWVTLEDEDGDPAASERIVMTGRPSG